MVILRPRQYFIQLKGPYTSGEIAKHLGRSAITLGCTKDLGQIGLPYVLLTRDSGHKSDWYLPDIAELNQLCKYATGQPWTSDETACSKLETRSLGFVAGFYWSSSEVEEDIAWTQEFAYGAQFNGLKSSTYHVRPVRAF